MYFPSYFKGLFDFGYQRRGLEIPTFYFVYLIGTIMAGAVVGQMISAIARSDQIRVNYSLDHITASIIYLLITYFIIKQKNLGASIKLIWLLPIATAALTLYVGHAIALIIPTVLSAVGNRNQKPTPKEEPKEKPEATNPDTKTV